MATRIVVISDTHCRTWEDVHPDIRKAVAEADIAVHCGDYTRPAVAEGMRRTARRAALVHGNSDPPELRRALPYVQVLEVEGMCIGVTHPAWGGPPFEPEELLKDFPGATLHAVLFGHLHEAVNEVRGGVLFLNPGQGYASFRVPATIALLTVDGGAVSGEIRTVAPGR